ncbi:MAG: hypothetical protein PWP23_2516 [Candidatus Sumerlaeota bacterium]|jgi:CBS domain-containing protein|nr:hypothetical protein [Candidatus Sumerlaeota bacterium]
MATVREVLAKKGTDVASVRPDDTVLEAARRMNERHIGAVMVMEDGRIAGIFTERDILVRVVGRELAPAETLVSAVMTAEPHTIGPDITLEECEKIITERRVRHLPIVENGRLLGMISAGDLLRHELEARNETIKDLHNYMYKS